MNAGNWLVHKGQWVLVPCGRKETVSGDVHYWECRFRREKTTRCPYKLTTVEEEDDLEPKIKYLMKTCMHTCCQDETHVSEKKIKELASSNFKKKRIPVAPSRLEDLAFSLLNTDSRNMENYILSHDPESKIDELTIM